MVPALRFASFLFKASNSLVRKPDAPATETKLAYCSRRRSPNELSRRRQSAIRSLSRHENDTFRRPLIFICNLSRSGIASPCCENRDFLSFENDDKTRRMVRNASLMVVQERPV